jgi:hypothetical protein
VVSSGEETGVHNSWTAGHPTSPFPAQRHACTACTRQALITKVSRKRRLGSRKTTPKKLPDVDYSWFVNGGSVRRRSRTASQATEANSSSACCRGKWRRSQDTHYCYVVACSCHHIRCRLDLLAAAKCAFCLRLGHVQSPDGPHCLEVYGSAAGIGWTSACVPVVCVCVCSFFFF